VNQCQSDQTRINEEEKSLSHVDLNNKIH